MPDNIILGLCTNKCIVSFFIQGKFSPFYQFAKHFNNDCFDYTQLNHLDYAFMRWKVSSL